MKFKREELYSLQTNIITNAFYTGNVNIVNAFMQDNFVKEFMYDVKQRNPLLYACFLNDMETIKEILSTNTNLMNERFLTVLYLF